VSRAEAGFPARVSLIVGDHVALVIAAGAGATRARSLSGAWEAAEQASATAASGTKDFHMPLLHRSRPEGSTLQFRRLSDTHGSHLCCHS